MRVIVRDGEGYRKLRPRKDLSCMLLQALCWKKKKKTSDLFARVFYGKAEWSTEERISKDYLLCKIKIKLKKYVRKISTDSQGGRTSNLSMGLISSINAGRGLC